MVESDYKILRENMVEEQLRSRDIKDERVLNAFRKVPRHLFVLEEDKSMAYNDYPLPIGFDQTISQPYIVALMTEQLHLTGNEKVLEIGTGSGYQSAILAELAKEVYTVERIEELSLKAREKLLGLGYANIKFKVADGTLGWEEESPFDGIIVTAMAPSIPNSLLKQLKIEGSMIIPIGGEAVQDLLLVKRERKSIKKTSLCGCIFVKLYGKEGWQA